MEGQTSILFIVGACACVLLLGAMKKRAEWLFFYKCGNAKSGDGKPYRIESGDGFDIRIAGISWAGNALWHSFL